MPRPAGTINLSIAVFYFFYFAATGVLIPYLPAYWRSLEFSGANIALLSSLAPLATTILPPAWGFLADRTGRLLLLLKIACIGAFCCLAPLLGVTGFLPLAAVMGAYAVFSSPITALSDTVAVVEARRRGTEYARLRLWGSLGFIVASLLVGQWLARGGRPSDAIPFALGFLACAALVAQTLRAPSEGVRASPPSLADARRLLAQRPFMLFLIAGMLHWTAIGPYYLFFTVHLKELGLGPGVAGWAFALGVTAEIGMMWCYPALRRRVSLFSLLVAASLLSSARWFLTGTIEHGLALALIQTGHAFTFGAFYVGSIAHLEATVPTSLRATGRALFSSVVLGLGGIIGNAIAGYLFDRGGGALAFKGAALLELTAPLILWGAFRTDTKKDDQIA